MGREQLIIENADTKRAVSIIRYDVEGGTFIELSNGVRRFGGSPYGDSFDDFESAFAFYGSIDIEKEHKLMSKSNLFGSESTYKRLDRIAFYDDGTANVDVIIFEYYNGIEVLNG